MATTSAQTADPGGASSSGASGAAVDAGAAAVIAMVVAVLVMVILFLLFVYCHVAKKGKKEYPAAQQEEEAGKAPPSLRATAVERGTSAWSSNETGVGTSRLQRKRSSEAGVSIAVGPAEVAIDRGTDTVTLDVGVPIAIEERWGGGVLFKYREGR